MRYFLVFALRFSGLALGFILSIVLAQNYTKFELGQYFIFIHLVAMGSILIRFGSDNALLKLSQYFSVSQKYIALRISSIIAIKVYVAIFMLLSAGYLLGEIDGRVAVLISITLLPFSFINYSSEYLKGNDNQNKGVLLQTVLIPLITMMLVLIYSFDLIYIYSSSILICFVISMLLFSTKGQEKHYSSEVITDYRSCLQPFFIVAVLNSIIATMDSFMIGIFSSLEEVATYNIANKVAMISSVFLVIANGIIGPIFSNLWQENKIARINDIFVKVTIAMAIVAVFIFLFFFYFGEILLIYIYGPEYTGSYKLLVILSFSQAIMLSTGPVAYLLMMTGSSNIHRKSLMISVVINIALNCLLIPHFGAVGAALATAISITIKNIYSLVLANNKFKFISSRGLK
ncbi:polysaccharide biosynthesis C-terminal domain-containing protein [uncultured Vibrio sp.]|uniref:oligosaccharide flippase family protein n=1 Tax=uncultured Vibrio sp. TaxID=114054 RepID=UPI0026080BC0|nr:polysaccharide biosynthesis C-terminal domain-containing protein [uncultured Vibrio sp.]